MIEIRAEKWVDNGYCLGYRDGKTYFIIGAIPGETVLCRPIFRKSGYDHLQVIEPLQPSPLRIPSDCKYSIECGGCCYRHISYEQELSIKQELLQKALGLSTAPQVISAQPAGYRNTVQLKLAENKIGFYKKHSKEVVDIRSGGCPNIPEPINQYLASRPIPEQSGELKLRYNNREIIHYNKKPVEFTIMEKMIRIPKNGFFQVNRFLLTDWLQKIQQLVGANADVLELFAGSGLISLFLAEQNCSIIGYEMAANAVRLARENLDCYYPGLAQFFVKNLYKEKLAKKSLQHKTYVINPPRSGIGHFLMKQLKKGQAQTMIYSSCHYPTLVRDFKELQKQGYHLEQVFLFDFFPRTAHFETLCKISRLP